MSERAPLDEIERYIEALELGLRAIDPAALEIAGPDLGDAGVTDPARARELLGRLNDLQERTEGQRVRVAGEIAGLRGRSVNDGHRRSPGSFDRSV